MRLLRNSALGAVAFLMAFAATADASAIVRASGDLSAIPFFYNVSVIGHWVAEAALGAERLRFTAVGTDTDGNRWIISADAYPGSVTWDGSVLAFNVDRMTIFESRYGMRAEDVGGTFTIDTNGAYFSGEVLGITTELIALP